MYYLLYSQNEKKCFWTVEEGCEGWLYLVHLKYVLYCLSSNLSQTTGQHKTYSVYSINYNIFTKFFKKFWLNDNCQINQIYCNFFVLVWSLWNIAINKFISTILSVACLFLFLTNTFRMTTLLTELTMFFPYLKIFRCSY